MMFVLSLCGLFLAGAVLLVPAWWAAGRLHDDRSAPFFRLLCAIGLALLGYIVCVNLLGRLIGNSINAVWICLLLNAMAGALLLWRRPSEEFRPIGIIPTWRTWVGPVLIACALGLPQWVVAVSTPYWDEVACSAIHLTAPNQFAEGIFPPCHNALPDISIKYHYGFTMLSGTVKWLFGVSSNVAIDLVSTGLWLFIFLFIYFWFCRIKFDRLAATWGAFTVLLGGGLAWLYLPRIEAYDGIDKVPLAADLQHRFDPAKSWLDNLIAAAVAPGQHLRNTDGSLSSLPWDIAAQFQQHPVSLGIAMALVALYLFTTWQYRSLNDLTVRHSPCLKNTKGKGQYHSLDNLIVKEERKKHNDRHWFLLAANVVAFSAIFLGQAVFGTVAAVAAGTCLLLAWVRERTWTRFTDGLLFTIGVTALALLHGGMLVMGPQYGGGGFVTVRRTFGYWAGGFDGFLHWNIAGFGFPLFLAIVALCLHRRRRDPKAVERNILFTALTVFGLFSYLVPQIVFYSSATYGVEQFTEISKFFCCSHFAMALLSAFGVAYLGRFQRWWVLAPCFLAMAISPVIFCYAHSITDKGGWLGFYHSSYHPNSIEEQMGKALRRLKKTNHDVFFDASADERRHGYLSELLNFGGSVFTMTPSRYERTGVGYRLSEDVIARRFIQNSRMARLLPGAAEEAGCTWYYCRPLSDMVLAPLVVRSRFTKLVAEGAFVDKFTAGERSLYAIEKPTSDLDRGIERYWNPKIISQTTADCDGNGKGDLIFFDYVAKKIFCGQTTIDLPDWLRGEFVNLYVARFPGDSKSDFHVGRMKDTFFQLGTRIEENVEINSWAWSYLDSRGGGWQPEYERWYWDMDIPLVADLDHDGFASHLAFRANTGEWRVAPDNIIPGPKVDKKLLPMPFAGRFLDGSDGDLGLWSILDGMVTLQTVATGKIVSFRWGGSYGFILVPGDYDGDGRDEIAIYNQSDFTWYWRHAPDGPLSSAKFGTKTGIPVPWDYNHDGRLDLAYWEPGEGKIYVSFKQGRSVDLVVPVPPNSIPAFVNMY